MRIVHEDHRVVLFAEGHDLVQLREVAVHREDAVGDHEAKALVSVLDELLLEVAHVRVLVRVLHRLAEAHAVHDRGVDEPVGDHDVLVGEDRLEDPGVRVEAGREQERVFRPEELRQAVLQLAVDVLRAADEADRRHAVPAAVEPGMRGREHVGVRGEAEVVVRAEVQDFLGRSARGELDLDLGPLRRVDDPLLLEEAGGFQGFELGAEDVAEGRGQSLGGHVRPPRE